MSFSTIGSTTPSQNTIFGAPVTASPPSTLGLENHTVDTTSQSQAQGTASYTNSASNPLLASVSNVPLSANQPTPPATFIAEEREDRIGNYLETQVKNGTLSEADADQMFTLYQLGEEDQLDPTLLANLQQGEESANTALAAKYNLSDPSTQVPRLTSENNLTFDDERSTLVDTNIRNITNPDGSLKYVNSNGTLTAAGATLEDDILSNRTVGPDGEAVIQAVANQMTTKTGYPGGNFSADFETQYTEEINQTFGSMVINQIKNSSLSPADQERAISLFYNPDPSDPLNAQVTNWSNQALSSLKTSVGANANPEPDTQSYDDSLDSSFLLSVQDGMNAETPPLTEDQQNFILSYVQNPSMTVPDDMKSILPTAQTINANALASLNAQFNPSATWQLNPASSLTAFINSPQGQYITNTQNALNKMVVNVNALTSSGKISKAQGATILSYLSAVMQALDGLRQMLATIELSNANQQKMVSSAQLAALQQKATDIQNASIRAQADEATEAQQMQQEAASQAKADKKNSTMKWLGPLLSAVACVVAVVITIGTFGLGSPGAIALVAAVIAITIAMTVVSNIPSPSGQGSILTDAMTKLDDKIKTACGGDKGAAIVEGCLAAVIIVAAIAVSVLTGNVALGLTLGAIAGTILSATNWAGDAVSNGMISIAQDKKDKAIANGEDPAVAESDFEKAQSNAEIVGMAVTVIALLVVSAGSGGGAAIAKKAADASKEGVEDAVNDAATVTKEATRLEKAMQPIKDFLNKSGVFKTMMGIQFGTQAAQTGMGVAIAVQEALLDQVLSGVEKAVAKRIADAADDDSAITLINAAIKMLEKFLASLQTGMDNVSQGTEDVTQLMSGIQHSNVQIVSSMLQANQS